MSGLIKYYCHKPSQNILENITLGRYAIRKLEYARNIYTGRFISKRSQEYVENSTQYVTVINFQVYNRINGRIVTNFICAYVKVIHAKHISYDARKYPENRSVRGEINIMGYIRLDQIDYTNPDRPILNKDVEDKLNEKALEEFFATDKGSWLEGIIEFDIIGTEVTDIYYPQYSQFWTLEAWYSHGEIFTTESSAEYKISKTVVIQEHELYQ